MFLYIIKILDLRVISKLMSALMNSTGTSSWLVTSAIVAVNTKIANLVGQTFKYMVTVEYIVIHVSEKGTLCKIWRWIIYDKTLM